MLAYLYLYQDEDSMNLVNIQGEQESKQTDSQEGKTEQQQTETAVIIKGAGKTWFSPLALPKHFLFRATSICI